MLSSALFHTEEQMLIKRPHWLRKWPPRQLQTLSGVSFSYFPICSAVQTSRITQLTTLEQEEPLRLCTWCPCLEWSLLLLFSLPAPLLPQTQDRKISSEESHVLWGHLTASSSTPQRDSTNSSYLYTLYLQFSCTFHAIISIVCGPVHPLGCKCL